MGKYVLGIDGGGTKTQCALFDIGGRSIDLVSWGQTNYENMKGGFMELKEELGKLISFVLRKNNIRRQDIEKSVLGLAGVDTPYQESTISGIIKDIGIENHILCNDGFLGVKAGAESGFGICAVNGTGCSVVGIDKMGNMLQIGGQGDMTGDCGGGGYLGRKAVFAVYDSLFRDGPRTCMQEMFYEYLGIRQRSEFMDAITQGECSGTFHIKDFNAMLFKAANMQDAVALGILENMGREYARSINSMIRNMNWDSEDPLEVVLAGSIHMKGENPAAEIKLKADVLAANSGMKVSFKKLVQPPVMGAIIWALESTEAKDELSRLRDEIIAQFSS